MTAVWYAEAVTRRGHLKIIFGVGPRTPEGCIGDLARTNPPGSKHVKRWQDVLEQLDAGMDVQATLDVRQVESLGDLVQQITGTKVTEAVPDAVLERADEIELVDRAPEEAIEPGTLLALRELALRRAADRVDIAYRKQRGIATTAVTERILVAVGPSPGSERLIRATKRIAEGLHAEWIAAHVEVLGAPPLNDKDRERVENHLRLAESLGAKVTRLAGVSVSQSLLEHARAHDVTRIVAGKPTHPRWRDRLRGSMLDALIRGSGTIEVHVIAPLDDGRPKPAAIPSERPSALAYVSAVVIIGAITALGLGLSPYASNADVTMLYLIGIALASLAGRGPSLLASSLAVAAFDFCFVSPRFTFAVSHASHILTFAVMFGSGLVISTFMVRLRAQERDAIVRERHTAALLAFTRDIAAAATPGDVAAVTVRHVENVFPVGASLLVPEADGTLTAAAGLMPLAAQEQAVARWALEHHEPAGLGTGTLPDAHVLALPLEAAGVIVVQARHDVRRRGGMALPLLEAFAHQAGLALARVTLAEQAREAALRAHTEELRSSLLSAVSHDLRTPLAVITGAATTLRDDAARLSPEAHAELLTSIVEDAQRLERVLVNLLQLTRVESGLVPNREWIPIEEMVGAALTRLEDATRDKPIVLELERDLMAEVDPVLFEQVLINLIDNGLKHGAPPIELHARRIDTLIEIVVRDHGPGIPAGVQVFDKFVRASNAPGAGLGLAVTRAIVTAHGGTITADTAPDGGARFRIELAAKEAPPLEAVA